MKKNYLRTGILLIVGISLITACKKGPDDKGGFASRNKQITGTWTLKSFDNTNNGTNNTIVTNSVNSERTETNITTSKSESYNGSTVTNIVTDHEVETHNYMQLNAPGDAYIAVGSSYDVTTTTTTINAMSFVISFYNDNTYKLVTSYSSTSEVFDGSGEYKDILGVSTSYDAAALLGFVSADYSIKPVDVSNNEEVGTWYWDENTNNSKLYIVAGPLSGNVAYLTKDEMTIEAQFGSTELYNMDGEETVANGNDEFSNAIYYSTYSNIDLTAMDNGTELSQNSWTNSEYIGGLKFEKTDKESDREAIE